MKSMSKTAKAVLVAEALFVLFTLNPQAAAQEPCVPPPSGLVSWWPGDGNASDIQGSNSGTLLGGATLAQAKWARLSALMGSMMPSVFLMQTPST